MSVLRALADSVLDSGALFEAFVSARYGASAGQLERLMRMRDRERQKSKEAFEAFVRERQRFHNFVHHLKQDGIITDAVHGTTKWYRIGEKGRRKLAMLTRAREERIPMPSYPKIEGSAFTIVAFDVPEREKKKREWLRSVLKRLGYKIVQRSVLLGKTKIPRQFLDDLRKLNMVEYVEIFEITKTGSLRHLL